MTRAVRSALLLVDLTNDVVQPSGMEGRAGLAEQLAEKKVVENSVRARTLARGFNLPVIHVAVGFREGYPEVNSSSPLFGRAREYGIGLIGSWGSEFVAPLEPAEDELVFYKKGVSAFTGNDLDRYLHLRGTETVILGGAATNFAVEGTAREAVDRGYRTIVLSDCCASFDHEQHSHSLNVILPKLALVWTLEDFATKGSSEAAQL